MRDRDDGQARRRQPRQIAKDVAAADKILDAVAQQIGAGALDQLHVRQLVLQRQFLHPQRLVEAVRLQRAGIDAGIIGADHAADAGDKADAGDRPAARDALVGIRHVEHVAGQRHQFDEGRAGIEHQRDALARQELPALVKAVLGGGGGGARALLQHAHAGNQRQHAVAVGLEPRAAGGDGVFDDGHQLNSRHSGMRKGAGPESIPRSWLWIPGSRFARPGMTAVLAIIMRSSSRENARYTLAATRPCVIFRSRSSASRRECG